MQRIFRLSDLHRFPLLLLPILALAACSSGTAVDRMRPAQQTPSEPGADGSALTIDGSNGIRYGVSFLSQSESKLKFNVRMTNISVMPVTVVPTDFAAFYSKDTGMAAPRFLMRSMTHAMDASSEKSTLDSMYTAAAGTASTTPEELQGLKEMMADWNDALMTTTIPPGCSAQGIVFFFPRREWPLVMVAPPYTDSTQKPVFRVDGR